MMAAKASEDPARLQGQIETIRRMCMGSFRDLVIAMAKDPALQKAFDERLADPAFAKSPEARLAFFHERSPWYATQRVGLYPVVRLDAAALASARSAVQSARD